MTGDCGADKGTYRGWQLHKQRKTKVCDDCAQAYVDHLEALEVMRATATGMPGRELAVRRRKYAEMALRVPCPASAAQVLSMREWQVAVLAARGLKNSAIATELCLSITTVKSHMRRIFEKLGVGSHPQMVAMVYRNGWLAADLAASEEMSAVPQELFHALSRVAYLLVYGQVSDAKKLAERLRPQLPRPRTRAPQ